MEDRLRKHGRGHGLVAQLHGYRVAAGRSFRRDPLLSAARKNQQTSFGTCMLERGAHQLVEQLFQDNCARDRLRQLDHGREVEVFDRRPDRAGRTGNGRLIPKPGI